MYKNNQFLDSYYPLERELHFTRVYKDHINKDKALREAACVSLQIAQDFRTLKNPKKDILAGRIHIAGIGFHAIAAGSDELDQTGYCFKESKCLKELEALKAYTEDLSLIEEAKEMIAFWSTEHTVAKGQKKITKDMAKTLTGLNYNTEIGTVYPLYRMAGIHLDVPKLLHYGLAGLKENITERGGLALYEGMQTVLTALQNLCHAYAQEMIRLCGQAEESRKKELRFMSDDLAFIKDNPPKTLHQAVQLVTLYMLACDNREIGRLDDYFSDFYKRDIENGNLLREEAVRLIRDFFDIIEEEFTRDTRAIIGGRGRAHEAAADELALVVLDALDSRPYGWQPQVSLRFYEGMDERLYDRAIEILGKGRTFPILYNDDVNVPGVMRSMDVSMKTAEQYVFFGCGEYMLAYESIGTPNALINLAKVLEVTLHNGIDPITGKEVGLKNLVITEHTGFEELMQAYEEQVAYCADVAARFQQLTYDICGEESSFLLASILTKDCISRGKGMFEGGIVQLGGTVETYGNITTSDSLYAIKEVVYDKKCFTLPKLVKMLQQNFVGYEKERQQLILAQKYGNDYDGPDAIAVRVHENVCLEVRKQREHTRLDSFLVVIINNSMNVAMGRCVGATPDGRAAGAFLSNANGAYNCCDKEGVTALMKSMTKLDTSIHAGANQNFKFSPSLFQEDGKVIKGLLKGFFSLGGQQTNLSVVNQQDLEDAMKHPENHENLIVRVGGYTARFITLDEATQKEVLSRTAY